MLQRWRRNGKGSTSLAPAKPKDLLPYAHQIFEIINDTYSRTVRLRAAHATRDRLLREDVLPEHLRRITRSSSWTRTDRLAAFVIAMPSLSRALQKARGHLFPFGVFHLLRAMKHPKTRSICIWVRSGGTCRGKGADAFLITALARILHQQGIVSAESNVELEENKLVQATLEESSSAVSTNGDGASSAR